MKNGLVSVLDIGTSKIVCLIADINYSGGIDIKGIGHQLSQGVNAGMVTDVGKAESCILSSVNAAEKMAGESIETVLVNVSGSMLDSSVIEVESSVSGQEITERDIHRIIQIGRSDANDNDKDIIHALASDYSIDGMDGVKNPVGMYGDKLSTSVHIISFAKTGIRNMTNCLARCHLDVERFVAVPFMSGLSTLSEDEKNLGAIHLDIGAGTTSISIFRDGHCIYVGSIPLGGNNITRDIARGLSISLEYAERIKTIYGTVVGLDKDKREIIDIPLTEMQSDIDDEAILSVGESYISRALLTSIIKPRMEEILEMTKSNIGQSGFLGQSGPRVILSGGASQLMGLKELTGSIFMKHVRIGKPFPYEGLAESIKGPAFASCVGMLKYASEEKKLSVHNIIRHKGKNSEVGKSSGIIGWFKENF